MTRAQRRFVRILSATVVGGTLLQVNTCGVAHFIENYNPCGTILLCDPVSYRFLTSGYKGPGADPDIDPACTYPPFCPGDPFVTTGGTP